MKQEKHDAFNFACYDALQKLGQPSTCGDIARSMGITSRELDVRRVLTRLHRQKAVSRRKVKGVWHYFV
jgi:alkylated DNA nucleotide flippase Atl1